ncbi:MAG: DoxX family membrane protein, partial [Bacteroidota bacterium]
LLRCILISGFCVGMLLSYPLWLVEHRIHPLIPALSGLSLPFVFHIGLFALVVLCGVFVLALPRYRKSSYLVMVCLVLFLIILDVSRFQPWVYYYLILLVPCLTNDADSKQGLRLAGLGLALIYIGSGWQKLNATFNYETLPWLMEPFEHVISHEFLISYGIGWFVATIELAAGVLILFRKTQRLGCVILIVMHLFILASLGPTGRSFNRVVWPWNISFCILLFAVFQAQPVTLIQWNASLTQKPIQWVFLVLLGVLPLLSTVGLWPKQASHALYSGNKVRSTLFFSDSIAQSFPTHLQQELDNQDLSMDMNNFMLATLRVPPYPSTWYHKRVFRALCEEAVNEFDVVLTLYYEPTLTSINRTEETLFCSD